MFRPRRPVSSLFIAALLGIVTFPAAADMPCGPKGGGHGMHGHGAGWMAQHHAKLHEALKLTPEQEVAWKKMRDSEHPMGMGMDRADAGKAEEWAKLSTPERADRMLERMRAHQAAMSDHVAALKEFYAILSPEQKKIFDDAHRGAPHPGRHGRHARPMAAPATS